MKLLTQDLLMNTVPFWGLCCGILENQNSNIGFCSSLNSNGITDSSQVNTLKDVLNGVPIYTYDSIKFKSMSIKGLRNSLAEINFDMSTYNGIGCTNGVTEICYAFDQLSSNYDQYIVSNVTSTFHNNLQESSSLYLNSASSIININSGQLDIFDAIGNEVLNRESRAKVDISDLKSGIYIVTQNGKRTKLIIE